jgi:hypothetical protein
MVYVNGAPRGGDPYGTGRIVLPIQLEQGSNELIFHVAGDRLRAALTPAGGRAALDIRDAAIPDLVRGETGSRWASVLVLNAAEIPLRDAELTVIRAGHAPATVAVGPVPACGVRQVAVPLQAELTFLEQQADAVRVQIDLTLPGPAEARLLADSAAFDLAVADAPQRQVRTFVSGVDGSVQSYVLLPAQGGDLGAESSSVARGPSSEPPPGLILDLHDGVQSAAELLSAARPLPWAHRLAPGGRRPRGCDWEDLSRRDALEALADATQRVAVDADRLWIAGTGSGGHGAWRLAALLPDRFAAAASLDGWIDYATYGGTAPRWNAANPVEQVLGRCAGSTELLPILENAAGCGLAVLHRVGGEGAPVSEAQRMRGELARFHDDFLYQELFEESAPPAAASPAEQPLARAFLRGHARLRSEQVDQVRFATRWLADSSRCRWLEIQQQQQQAGLSRAEFALLKSRRQILGMTENVAACAVDVASFAPGEPLEIGIDGQALGAAPWPEGAEKRLHFVRAGGFWRLAESPPARHKSPVRPGGFRTVFDRRAVLVYGTRGTAEENAWAEAKARFDAETLWIRAAGVADVVPDEQFQAAVDQERNVLLYGNADTNAAWPGLLSTSPVQIRRGSVRIGQRPEIGDDLACLFVHPRPGSAAALVGVVGGSALRGMRATDRLPYFVNGVVLPDLVLFGADAQLRGAAEFRAAGFFANDWSIDGGDIAWRDAAL